MYTPGVFMFLFFILLTSLAEAKRGSRINIFKQKNGNDILQLRRDGPQRIARRRGIMFNALPARSTYRWTTYNDSEGNFYMPYEITGSYEPEELAIIAGAMDAIENNTCIRFRKHTDEKDFLDIQNTYDNGCYTTVGRQPGRNVVMLEANKIATCVEHDVVIHELMHAIGLWHEHMRLDRDNYIKVHYENIESIYRSQFDKVSPVDSTTYDVPYDYRSVMHYGKDAFGRTPTTITMEPLNKAFTDVIGHALDASPSDYLKICSIYSCARCMNRPFEGDKTVNSYIASWTTLPPSSAETPPATAQTTTPTASTTPATAQTTPATAETTPATASTTTATAQASPADKECNDKTICMFLVNAWNKEYICIVKKIKAWCCKSCTEKTDTPGLVFGSSVPPDAWLQNIGNRR